MTIATFPGENYLLDDIAQAEGFNAKNHLKVTYVKPQSGANAAQLLAAGGIDGWNAATSIVVNADAHGQSLVLVGMTMPFSTFPIDVSQKMSWPSSSATFQQKMSAFKNRSVGDVGIGSANDQFLVAALQAAGVPVSSVHRIGIGQQTAAVAEMASGRIDAYVQFSQVGAYYVTHHTNAKFYLDLGLSAEVPSQIRDASSLALATTKSYAAGHPKEIAAWRNAIGESLSWVRNPAHWAAAARILVKYSGYTGDTAAAALAAVKNNAQVIYPHDLAGLKVSQSAIAATVNLLVGQGTVPASAKDSVTYSNLVAPVGRS